MKIRMISFFPDVNVWLALSDAANVHNAEVWNWFNVLPRETKLIFSRYTQLGLLRLLTNASVMQQQVLTLQGAWAVYDRWMEDARVQFYPEPSGLENGFREATLPFADRPASKWIGDCYLLAFAKHSHARLVTFDKGLRHLAARQHCPAIEPG